MNILNYLYIQDTDLEEVIENQAEQTVGGREPIATANEFWDNAVCIAKDTIEYQFEQFNNSLQTVH